MGRISRVGVAALATSALLVPVAQLGPGSAAAQPSPSVVSPPVGTPSLGTPTPRALTTTVRRQALLWRPCFGDAECADLRVPRDYTDPAAGTTSIAVLRMRTSDPVRRVGHLVVNPGGPGVAGRTYATAMSFSLPDQVTSRYDIVGFDPRGTGESGPLRCQSQADIRPWLTADSTPDTRAEVRRLVGLTQAFADSCADRHGAWLGQISTRDVTRDLDLLRAALGDSHLNFIGASYGTYLGTLYADAFPDRVGRLVLDGAVDPRDDVMGLTERQIGGFDHAIVRMARHCTTSRSCEVPGTGTTGVLRSINRLLQILDVAPVPSRSGSPLTQQAGVTGILAGLYDEGAWDSVLQGVAQALDGDGYTLATLSRGFLTSDATFLASFLSITCADSPRSPRPPALASWADRQAKSVRVPEVARYLAWSVLPCSVWPTHSDIAPGPVRAIGAPPILVVGTTHDPATPLEGARALARQLPGAMLLTYDGDGHTALGRGSTCIDRAVGRFLARGTLPEPGTQCRSKP